MDTPRSVIEAPGLMNLADEMEDIPFPSPGISYPRIPVPVPDDAFDEHDTRASLRSASRMSNTSRRVTIRDDSPEKAEKVEQQPNDAMPDKLKKKWAELETALSNVERIEGEYVALLTDYTHTASKSRVSEASVARINRRVTDAMDAIGDLKPSTDTDRAMSFSVLQKLSETRRVHADFPELEGLSSGRMFPVGVADALTAGIEAACDIVSRAVVIPAGLNVSEENHSKESLEKLKTQHAKMVSMQGVLVASKSAETRLGTTIDATHTFVTRRVAMVAHLQEAITEVESDAMSRSKTFTEQITLLEANCKDLRKMQPLRRKALLKNLKLITDNELKLCKRWIQQRTTKAAISLSRTIAAPTADALQVEIVSLQQTKEMCHTLHGFLRGRRRDMKARVDRDTDFVARKLVSAHEAIVTNALERWRSAEADEECGDETFRDIAHWVWQCGSLVVLHALSPERYGNVVVVVAREEPGSNEDAINGEPYLLSMTQWVAFLRTK